MWKYLKNNKGSTIVIITVVLVALLGFVALVTDIGNMVYRKSQLQNACDAAALAGAHELPDTDKAEDEAKKYAEDNGVDLSSISISFGEEDKKIIVKAQEQVQFIFARVLGINQGDVSAQAAAIIAPLSEVYNGLRPFGVEDDAFEEGERVVLKTGVQDEEGGNFYPLALDGTGATTYQTTIVNGSNTGYSVGDYVSTETGNMVGPTKSAINDLIGLCDHSPECTPDSYEPDCPRVVTVPLIESMEVNGRDEVLIVGFAIFFVEAVTNSGGFTQVTGTFVEEITTGGMSQGQTDYGLRGVKLVD